jgi:outer membrane protein
LKPYPLPQSNLRTTLHSTLPAVLGGLIGLAGLLCALPARAQVELPRWEFGLSTVGLYVPDYRGADEMRARAFVLPYIVYRGEYVRADRDGVRADLLKSDRVRLTFSGGLGLPVNSNRNEARRGMPEINWVLELGPALNVNLTSWDEGLTSLDLRLPVRAAFAIDSGFDYIGAVTSPNLRLTQRTQHGVTYRLSTGPIFATADYHRFYYGVEPQFATATRPAYRPSAGYSGWDLGASAVTFTGNWRLFAFAGADLLKGATFDQSPLIRQTSNWSVGFGAAYVFFKSKTMVRTDE